MSNSTCLFLYSGGTRLNLYIPDLFDGSPEMLPVTSKRSKEALVESGNSESSSFRVIVYSKCESRIAGFLTKTKIKTPIAPPAVTTFLYLNSKKPGIHDATPPHPT